MSHSSPVAPLSDFDFTLRRLRFNEHYTPSQTTRLTTNFANLARGDTRQQNLRNALRMIDNRFNALAHWDNPNADRYAIELDIISVEIDLPDRATNDRFPLLEILNTTILDRHTSSSIAGMTGNNLSSFVRDYDFSVVLPAHNRDRPDFSLPPNFGDLHGHLFLSFVRSPTYKAQFHKPPVICLSVANSKTYRRTNTYHPILGVEYEQNDESLTDIYFRKMGLTVRFFMPPGSVAPLAFYFFGDLLSDYTSLELISTISTMESFQKIYRPEIYNANAAAGAVYQPSLQHPDYSLTQVVYDREERSRLAVEQGRFAEAHFITPYRTLLEQWSAHYA
ncbi:DUF1852 domain-containing protein [Asticcacaulis excentricus]|uniref:DUF1852 domain-containing protein n=1 Tax=Asticcacaulis excentricus (strain ATCC 15261 / DSM 4724 / KCTC 12464 / NCIMB 9791 / VKM B-1370 / CB 48) TaxID=573065 RepID=E8RRD2_ASTEC|nr:DUF1852 domain-containing protein [Asticcacaulis excentricus]ADU12323.1 Domain of unknown function DUF1852 [Asticcacaulis excentricus CB 48]